MATPNSWDKIHNEYLVLPRTDFMNRLGRCLEPWRASWPRFMVIITYPAGGLGLLSRQIHRPELVTPRNRDVAKFVQIISQLRRCHCGGGESILPERYRIEYMRSYGE